MNLFSDNSFTRANSIKFDSNNLLNSEILDQSLICSICQDVLKLPKECLSCHNNFCKSCIRNWIKSNNRCPFRCHGDFKFTNSPLIIYDMLNILKFKCKNEGCNEITSYDGYINHHEVCLYREVQCKNKGCSNKFKALNQDDHYNRECDYQTHHCNKCTFVFYGPKVIEHDCVKVALNSLNELKTKMINSLINLDSKCNNIEQCLEMIKNNIGQI